MSDDFEWDVDNIWHIARHNVTPEEAEAMLMSNPRELGYKVVDGEVRFGYVGPTLRTISDCGHYRKRA